jgi:hypothetical protein
MTWYYVYVIERETTSLPSDLSGMFGEDLSTVRFGSLAAVVGEVQAIDQLSMSDTAMILRHHRIVSQLCEQHAALPVQFGSLAHGVERIKSILEEHHEMLASDLTRLSGKVEFGITIPGETSLEFTPEVEKPEEDDSERSGSDYMKRRFGEYLRENELRAEAEKSGSELSELIGTLAEDQRYEVLPRTGILFRASYLVDASRVDSFEEKAALFTSRNESLEVVLVGPWPPYSFVSTTGLDIEGMFGAINR